MVYVAVRGSQADGHRFVADAVRRGAVAVVVEAPQQSAGARDRGARRPAGRAGRWRGPGIGDPRPAAHADRHDRHQRQDHDDRAWSDTCFNGDGTAGSIGTLGAFDGAGEAVPSTAGSLTTPGPIDLQATLARCWTAGVTHVAMETSSHSLDQGRLDGLDLRRRRLHQPDTRPPRLSRHHGALPRRQAPAQRAISVSTASKW